jgi:hypothetical protein
MCGSMGWAERKNSVACKLLVLLLLLGGDDKEVMEF